MEDKEFYIPCDDCEYYLNQCCTCPDDAEKLCKGSASGAGLGLGTLYDVNKQVLMQMPKLSKNQILEKLEEISLFVFRRRPNNPDGKSVFIYYMLLNNEKRDYTLFNFKNNHVNAYFNQTFKQDMFECLLNRGDVISIEETPDNLAFEIWLRTEEEILCYYFFPYDVGVLEYNA